MTSKNFLIIGFIVIAFAALGEVSRESMIADAPQVAAKAAPLYVPITDSEAIMESLLSCKNDSNQLYSVAMAGGTCESVHANPSARLVELAQASHKAIFFSQEIQPRVEIIKSGVNGNFTAFYIIIALIAAASFLWWFKDVALPFLGRSKQKLRNQLPSQQDLKKITAGKRVRQAENDFLTLKNLHDNELITDEMFLQRKAELKASLSSNEIFGSKK